MRSMTRALTKRSTVVGLPIGRRRVDWAEVARLGTVGLSAISAVADVVGGYRSARHDRESDTGSSLASTAVGRRRGDAASRTRRPR
jgi:hypothetical protein